MDQQKDWRAVRRKRLQKRTGVALICVAIALALRFVLTRMIGPDSPLWQRLLFFVVVYGPVLSGVLYISQGWFGIVEGITVVILLALKGVFPKIWNVLLIVTCLALVIANLLLRKHRRRKLTVETTAEKDRD